jgi:hypothetical protein
MQCGGMIISGRHRGWPIRVSQPTKRGGVVGTIARATRTCAARSAAFDWGRTSSSAAATSKENGKIVTGTIMFIIRIKKSGNNGTKLKNNIMTNTSWQPAKEHLA